MFLRLSPYFVLFTIINTTIRGMTMSIQSVKQPEQELLYIIKRYINHILNEDTLLQTLDTIHQ